MADCLLSVHFLAPDADLPESALKAEFGSVDDNEDDFVQWTDEFSDGDILNFLQGQGLDVDNDDHLRGLLEASERVSLTRQFGDWIEVEVDGQRKRVTCNCEDYNFHYICFHQVTFELLQFGQMPNNKCSRSTENWTTIRERVIEFLKEKYLDVAVKSN